MADRRRNRQANGPANSGLHSNSTASSPDPRGRFSRQQFSPRQLRWLVALLVVLAAVWVIQRLVSQNPAVDTLARPNEALTSQPLAPKGVQSPTLFESLPAEATGIDFVGRIDNSHPMKYLYETGFTGGGVAIGDVNGDGWPDVYFVSGPGPNRLYLQDRSGGLRFHNATEQAGVDGGTAWGAGAAMADVNNDGRLDIYVCNYDSPNQLFINQGDGTFREMAGPYGLAIVDACLMAAFCDFDLDGDLDMYVLANRYVRPEGRPDPVSSPIVEIIDGQVRVRPEFEKYYQPSFGTNLDDRAGRSDGIFRNNGDGTFSDVSIEAGLWGRFHGLSVTWLDFDDDGWPDVYIGNDFNGPDQLYRNNGDGTFTDVIQQVVPHTPWFSMGADAADLNNDGRVDLLTSDMSRTTHLARMTSMGSMEGGHGLLESFNPRQYMWNALLINTGMGRFLEAARMAGVESTDWTWAVKLADFDNDGRVDAYFSNGFTRDFSSDDYPTTIKQEIGRTTWDLVANQPPLPNRNLAFRNLGDLRFQDVGRAWGLDHLGMSMSAAYSDLDRDGDLDLIVMNVEGPVSVYRNGATDGHGVLIRLEGAGSNRFGLGAEVRIKTTAGEQVRWLSPMTGYNSTNEPLVHFGLGDAETIDELTIAWPGGHRQSFQELPADRLYTIAEPPSPPPPRSPPARKTTWFASSTALAAAIHRERHFNDFEEQPLLPRKLSQLGPALAWGDIDRDGDDDLFLGGAAGSPGAILLNQGGGRFERHTPPALIDDRECEDMGAVWFDADADGSLDLYVVSGGVEFGASRRLLRDRLYLNDGRGRLTKAAFGTLPVLEDSGGPVAAADFDRDGDVDLFVGGRVVPGQYPLPSKTRMLRNDGGQFTDATGEIAPQLLVSGLVTSALWTDVDGDGWLDLLVTHEWGPVKLFRNEAASESRTLVDRTGNSGLAPHSGWWNGITGRDIDNDGDIDYVATNAGLNTRYRASPDEPAVLYYGDFGGSRRHQVEAYFDKGRLLPVRTRLFSEFADPLLPERFKTHEAFGRAKLEEIYSPEALSAARRFSVTNLESGLLLNDGRGRFEFRPLPRLAQISPGFGAAFLDFDADGRTDLCIAQNDFSPRPGLGRFDSGLSLLLRGDGQGNFLPVMPEESGLVVPGDAKSLAIADVTADGRPDLVVGVNDAEVKVFEARASTLGRPLHVRLSGKPGNPTAIGARVTLRLDDGAAQTAEIYAGDGYLSQSAAGVWFGVPNGRQVDGVVVRWPDGETTTTDSPNVENERVVIER
jgi:hypothetical protein